MIAASKMAGSTHRAGMARPRKRLTKREQRTPKGRFATHLEALMEERGWNSLHLSMLLGIGEPTVRKWLRAESVPETLDLLAIGRAFDVPGHPFPDYRHILPPE